MKKKTTEALSDEATVETPVSAASPEPPPPAVSEKVATSEYEQLTEEFPELKGKSFDDLPQEVRQAAEQGEKLLTAYLYYRHEEAKRISEATKTAALADEKSAGSMKSHFTDGISEANRRYLNALWGRS
ncbi:MAG: hypothetical protein IKD04_10410 [Clostridia bacterium]|nr:hypothetical protein [Clostridia bacterium]